MKTDMILIYANTTCLVSSHSNTPTGTLQLTVAGLHGDGKHKHSITHSYRDCELLLWPLYSSLSTWLHMNQHHINHSEHTAKHTHRHKEGMMKAAHNDMSFSTNITYSSDTQNDRRQHPPTSTQIKWTIVVSSQLYVTTFVPALGIFGKTVCFKLKSCDSLDLLFSSILTLCSCSQVQNSFKNETKTRRSVEKFKFYMH